MKKGIVFLFAILLLGCATGWDVIKKDGYDIYIAYQENLKGNYYQLLYGFYSNIVLSYSEYFSIDKFVRENKIDYYTITYHYNGDSWRFINNLILKVDDNLYELSDDNPLRDVGYGGYVTEVIIWKLGSEIIDNLEKAKVIKLQVWIDPITLDNNQVSSINSFIKDTRDMNYNNIESYLQ